MSTPAQSKAPEAYFDANVVTSIGKEAAAFATKISANVQNFAANPAGSPLSGDMRRLNDMVRIVGLRAVVKLIEAARDLAVNIEAGKTKAGPLEIDTLRKALSNAQRYLQNTAAGKIDSGIGLVPVAREIAKLAGGDSQNRLIEGEFFLPVMPRLTQENKAFNKAQFVADIKRYHADFRGAMLEFTKSAVPETITAMRRDLITMEQKGPPASCRFFFSAAIAFFDIVIKAEGKIPPEHAPLVTRIDKELAKFAGGELMTPDSTLSWLLYFIAKAEPVSARVERLKFIFALDEYLATGISLHLDEATIQGTRNALDVARKAWEAAFSEGGNPASVKAPIFALAASCNTIGDDALKIMGVSMGGLADGISSGKIKPSEKIAVFGATIMLQLEERLDRVVTDPTGGRAIANLQKDRVRAVLSGKSPDSVVENKEGNKATYVKNILDEVASLISAAEQIIEQSIREPGKTSKVDEVARIFGTAQSAMQMLSMKEAAEFVKLCSDEVKRMLTKTAAGEALTDPEKVLMAESIMTLTQFLGVVVISDTQGKQVIAKGMALFAKKEEPVAVAPSVVAGMEVDVCQDPEISEIFFDEADEIIGQIEQQGSILKTAPSHAEAIKDVRRFFHTLKGGARMVELTHLGNVAWHVERTLNEWIAKKKPCTPELLEWMMSAQSVFKTQIPLLRSSQRAESAPKAFELRADQFLGLIDQPAAPVAKPAAVAAPAAPVAAPVAKPAAGPAEAPPAVMEFDIQVPDLSPPPVAEKPAEKPAEQPAAKPAEPEVMDFKIDFPVELPSVAAELAPVVETPAAPVVEAPALMIEVPAADPVVAVAEQDKKKGGEEPVALEIPALTLEVEPAAPAPVAEPVVAGPAPAAEPAIDFGLPALDFAPAQPAAAEPAKATVAEVPAAPPAEVIEFKLDLVDQPAAAPVAVEPVKVEPPVAEPAVEAVKVEAPAPEMALDFPALSLDLDPPAVEPVMTPAPAVEVEAVAEAQDKGAEATLDLTMVMDAPTDHMDHKPVVDSVAAADLDLELNLDAAPEAVVADPVAVELPAATSPEMPSVGAPVAAESPIIEVVEASVAESIADSDEVVVGDVRIQRQVFDVYVEESVKFVDNLRAEFKKFYEDESHVVGYDIMRYAHSIAGMGRTTGFTAITQLASAIESWSSFHLDRPVQLEDDLKSVLMDAVEALDAMVVSSCEGIEPVAEDGILARLNTVVESVGHNVSLGSAEDAIARLSHVNEIVDDTATQSSQAAQPEVPAANQDASDEMPGVNLDDIERQIAMAALVAEPAQPAQPAPAQASGSEDMASDSTVWIEIVHTKMDDIDKEAFNFFREEAEELFPQIDRQIELLKEGGSNDRETTNALKRAVHTLKGGANTAGARKIGGIFHFLEDLMGASAAIDRATLSIVQSGVDASHAAMSAMIEGTSIEAAIIGGSRDVAAAAEQVIEPMAVPSSMDFLPLHGTAVVPSSLTRHFKKADPAAPNRRSNDEDSKDDANALRMSSKLLQHLVNVSGEINITRGRAIQQTSRMHDRIVGTGRSITAMAAYLRQIELEAEKQMEAGARSKVGQQGIGDKEGKFDALEFDRFTRLQELTRRIAEAQNDIVNQYGEMLSSVDGIEDAMADQGILVSELGSHLDRVRQVRISTVVPRLKRTVRAACRDANKSADIVIDADVQIDRGILNKIMGSVDHILRNAIAHGIESPEARSKAGKDGGGMIEFRVYHDGSETVIEIRDDGAGVNTKRVFAKAVERGLAAADTQLNEEQIREFLFHPGFSTAEQVTELSGRGVGLDVVRSDIAAMGGRISMWSQEGVGTQFTIRVPSTLTIIQGSAVYINKLMYVMPSAFVSRMIRVSADALNEAYKTGRLVYKDEEGGEEMDFIFYGLWQMVGLPRYEGKIGVRNTIALMREHNVAVHIDDMMPSNEYVFKTMGPQVQAQSGLMGSTVNGDGDAALVIDPSRIARNMALSKIATAVEREDLAPLVMVVDDSITVRKFSNRMLTREGFRVVEAENGMVALEKMQTERPGVILLDIEMPVMDGFTCAQAIRNTNSIKDIPIIMITSRTAEKHRNHALSLGVNEYLGKPYNDADLLKHIRNLLGKKGKKAA